MSNKLHNCERLDRQWILIIVTLLYIMWNRIIYAVEIWKRWVWTEYLCYCKFQNSNYIDSLDNYGAAHDIWKSWLLLEVSLSDTARYLTYNTKPDKTIFKRIPQAIKMKNIPSQAHYSHVRVVTLKDNNLNISYIP